MNEVLRCKVRDIKDSAGRWEIRLERRNIPTRILTLAGNQIIFRLSGTAYTAHTGIACRGKPGQYFWINTHANEAGPIKNILKSHGYQPNDELLLVMNAEQRTAYVTSASEARLHNVIDMGLDFSAMIRLFQKKSKEKLWAEILASVQRVFEAESEAEFKRIHSDFCHQARGEIRLAKKNKLAEYGQIAKTLDVALKVIVYYSRLPNNTKSAQISKWLNAAVDTRMMAMLRRYYPTDIGPWPTNIGQVSSYRIYDAIQETVRKFIHDQHDDTIIPVQFDDIYWEALNRLR